MQLDFLRRVAPLPDFSNPTSGLRNYTRLACIDKYQQSILDNIGDGGISGFNRKLCGAGGV
jgi:hypothetical protein